MASHRNEIFVKKPKILDKSSISYDVIYPSDANKFFTGENFFAQYNVKINKVPESILIIPLLSNICPIAWVNNLDIYIEKIDREFYKSLQIIKESFRNIYPNLKMGGEIYPEEIIDNSTDNNFKNSAILFSGGIDSLTTYIMKRHEKPLLISVWGADIRLNEQDVWKKVKTEIENFGQNNGLENLFITSNVREFIDEIILNAYYKEYVGNWWGGIQHGLGLLGLCAPLTYYKKIGKIYISSTHTKNFLYPWGSHPAIDENIKWNKTRIEHYGYGLTRQEKVKVIADHIKKEEPDLKIRVCLSPKIYGNCSKCEKCLRTEIALIIEGINPNQHGFNVNKNTIQYGKRRLENGGYYLDEDELFMWEDIKNHISFDQEFVLPECEDFLKWLINADLRKIKQKSQRRRRIIFKNIFINLIKYFPYWYLLLRTNRLRKFARELYRYCYIR